MRAHLRSRLDGPHFHVVISAPWIPTPEWQSSSPNFRICNLPSIATPTSASCRPTPTASNSSARPWKSKQAASISTSPATAPISRAGSPRPSAPCTYLPNLYFLDAAAPPTRPLYHGGTFRIGAFGATRPLKNFMSAAGAALEIARSLKPTSNSGSPPDAPRAAANHRSVRAPCWMAFPASRSWRTLAILAPVPASVGHMHLLLQPSYTESFNMVTADGIAEGVPSVVSDAIDWAPGHWKA